jgi:tripartite-type tricarboxylate transporter receptor subunit TctC
MKKALLIAALISVATAVQAQSYPNKPIRWIVPYTGGGITDVVTRVVTQKMQAALGQPIVVENKPGANSIIGSSGIGAAAHLTTELLKQTAGIDMVHVPFKGTAPALLALQANDIQILVDVPSTLMPHVRGGKIKALAMFSGKRIQGAAEVPTMAEAGGPGLESSTWVMFLAPASTPREIINRLSQEADKAVNAPEIKGRFSEIGIEPVGGTPEQTSRFLAGEIAKWSRVITTAGVKAEQ